MDKLIWFPLIHIIIYRYYPFDDSGYWNLMTQGLVDFGHAVNNDIGFLFKDCNRYKLPLFDYTAYDVQNASSVQ